MNISKKNLTWISKVIWIYLFLGPFFDVFTSFSIHFLGRSLYFILGLKIFFLVFLFFLNVKFFNKKSILYCLFFGLYFLLFFSGIYFQKGGSSFLLEVQNFFRTFYFPISLVLLYPISEKGYFKISKKYLIGVLCLYLCFLVIPQIFQVGFDSYAHSKMGNLGWFYSTNEIGGILAILGPFVFSYIYQKKWYVGFLLVPFYLSGLLLLGTKVPILSFFLILFCYFIYYLRIKFRKREWKKILMSGLCSIFLVVSFGFLLIHTSFYKNIQIHLDFLGIHEVRDLLTFHHIDHFIFSERLSFLQKTQSYYETVSVSQKIVGTGITVLNENQWISMKMIEMDYFDIFYHYGILGTCFFLAPFFIFSFRRKYDLDEKISLLLVFVLAFFSGHILISPSVSILVVVLFLRKKGDEMNDRICNCKL